MQTLNFQCGHCGNLMAVSLEYLGQQVRCPHCGGVVVAPREAPVPTSSLQEPPVYGKDEPLPSEDIFSESPPPSDSLFDEEPYSPTQASVGTQDEQVQDSENASVPGQPEPVVGPAEVPESPQLGHESQSQIASTYEHSFEKEPADTNGVASSGNYTQHPSTSPGWPSAVQAEPPSEAAPPPAPGVASTEATPTIQSPFGGEPEPARVKRPAPSMGLFVPLFVLPLILYAIGMTAAATFLYMRLTSSPANVNPFEQMPDVDGDNPGVQLKKLTLRFGKKDALAPLPEQLILSLNQTLQLGDLEVTPLRVERKEVRIFDERQGNDGEPEPLPSPPLVLTLRVKNLAKDYSFTPMDNYFDRHWNGKTGSAPLTVLLAGNTPFFGGPAKWVPQKRDGKRREFREWLEGRSNTDPRGLAPGEAKETFVCTDGGDEATVRRLFGEDLEGNKVGKPFEGNFLWRVQLRRGLIEHNGKRYPATCVIGVQFTHKNIGQG
jgi:DNA-directed RNA polymerase subunit RPC12/RpoP